MVKLPTKTLERQLLRQGYGHIIGVDEVGMACLAGPVVVCALAVAPDFYHQRYPLLAGLCDSKALAPHHRERLAQELMRTSSLRWRIAACDPVTIDRINIYQASRLAMRQAIQNLGFRMKNKGLGPMILIDGNKLLSDVDLPQQAIVRGDRKIWAIAAASVLAKVHRDRLMTNYALRYPGYGFEVHKGYPTAVHRSALARLGPCPLHRRSFAGIGATCS